MNQALIPFDTDPLETREWRESLEAVMQAGGRPRAHYLIDTSTPSRPSGNRPTQATWPSSAA